VEVEHCSKNNFFLLVSPEKQHPHMGELVSKNPKTQNHLFIHCSFTHQVWNLLVGILKSWLFWDGSTVDECMMTWVRQHPNLTELPSLVCWYIWLERNKFLFNNEIISPYGLALKSIGSFNVCVSSHNGPKLYRFKSTPWL
jgi:hypothetical protein